MLAFILISTMSVLYIYSSIYMSFVMETKDVSAGLY